MIDDLVDNCSHKNPLLRHMQGKLSYSIIDLFGYRGRGIHSSIDSRAPDPCSSSLHFLRGGIDTCHTYTEYAARELEREEWHPYIPFQDSEHCFVVNVVRRAGRVDTKKESFVFQDIPSFTCITQRGRMLLFVETHSADVCRRGVFFFFVFRRFFRCTSTAGRSKKEGPRETILFRFLLVLLLDQAQEGKTTVPTGRLTVVLRCCYSLPATFASLAKRLA